MQRPLPTAQLNSRPLARIAPAALQLALVLALAGCSSAAVPEAKDTRAPTVPPASPQPPAAPARST